MKNLIIFVFPLEENCKSSHRRCSARKGILRKFSKFTGKHSNTGVRCFPVNFGKFLRTLFLQNTSGRVLLKLILLPTRLKRPISNCSQCIKWKAMYLLLLFLMAFCRGSLSILVVFPNIIKEQHSKAIAWSYSVKKLLHRYFYVFKIVQMVSNRAKRLIYNCYIIVAIEASG